LVQRTRAELPPRCDRLPILDDCLIQLRVVGDAAHGAEVELEIAELHGLPLHPDELLALGREREAGPSWYAARRGADVVRVYGHVVHAHLVLGWRGGRHVGPHGVTVEEGFPLLA